MRIAACLAIVTAVLFGTFSRVIMRKATIVPHAPGVFFHGPYGYGEPPPQSVQDPWGTVWEEMPLARVVRAQAIEGIPPLWNPYTACGVPLAAGLHSEAFSVFRWPLFIYPSTGAWDAFFLIRLLVAGVLAFFLALELGLGFPASSASSCAFMLSGYLVSYVNLFHLDVDVFLPGAVLCSLKILKGGGIGWIVAAAALFAQMALGGNPQAAAVDFIFIAAWMIFYAVRNNVAAGRVLSLVFAFFSGLCFSLPLMLPFAEFFEKAFHVHTSELGSWWGGTVLPWQGFPAAFVPLSFGPHFAPAVFHAQGLIPYVGVGTFLLAVQGWGWGSARSAWMGRFLALAILLELAKIYGVPPVSWLGYAPFFSLIVWAKHAAPLFLSVALLCGMGMERVFEAQGSLRRMAVSAAFLFFAAAWAFAAGGNRGTYVLGWGLAAFLTVAWFVLAKIRVEGARGTAWIGFSLLALELMIWVQGTRARVHDPLAPAPYVEFLRERLKSPAQGRIFGLGFNLAPNVNAAFGLSDARSLIDPLVPKGYWEFMNREVAEKRRDAFKGFLKADSLDDRALRALSLAGVRYLVSTRESREFIAEGTRWPLSLVYSNGMNVYENPLAFPRSFLIAADSGEVKPARITDYSPMEVVIEPPAGLRGDLVLSDTDYPGWRAYTGGGSRLRIGLFSGAFRKVSLDGTVRRLRFVYAPLSFALGLWLAGVLGAGVLFLLAAAQSRRV